MPVTIKGTDLVYFPVPKVACTSIKAALLRHNDPLAWQAFRESKAENPLRELHDKYDSLPLNLGHLVGPRWRGKWFCVVRDPIARFVSGYRNRVLFHQDLSEAPLPSGLAKEPSIDEFAGHLSAYCAANPLISHHFRPQVDFLGKSQSRFERIFNIRELANLKSYLAEQGVEVEFERFQEGGPKMDPSALSAASVEKLRAFYSTDSKVFGDFFERS